VNCPGCDGPMTEGEIRLRAQWIARVLFTPAGVKDGFVQRHLAGTLFDRGLRPGEAEIVSNYADPSRQKRRPAFRCPACGTLVLPA